MIILMKIIIYYIKFLNIKEWSFLTPYTSTDLDSYNKMW